MADDDWDPDYEDDDYYEEERIEPVEVDTKEQGLEQLRLFFVDGDKYLNSVSYAVVTQKDDGSFLFTPMYNNPCYGNLRKYGSGSTRPNDHKPGDLKHPLTLQMGNPVAVALSVRPKPEGRTTELTFSDVWEGIFLHEKSPWINTFKNIEIIESKKWHGVVIPDTSIDSTLLVSAFKNAQHFYGAGDWEFLRHPDIHPVTRYIFSALARKVEPYWDSSFREIRFRDVNNWVFHRTDEYSNSSCWSFKKFWNGQYNDLTGGLFSDGFDYNRPYLHHIFSELPDGFSFPEPKGKTYNATVPSDNIPEVIKGVFQKVFKDINPSQAAVLEAIKEVDNEFEVLGRS